MMLQIQLYMYGVQAWNLSDNGTKAIHTMWNRCARRVLGLPAQTHTRYLPHLLKIDHSSVQVYKRIIKLVHTMLKSKNETVKYLANNGLNSMKSIIGQNLSMISHATKVPVNELTKLNSNFTQVLKCSTEDYCIIQLIRDLHSHELYVDPDSHKDTLIYLCTILLIIYKILLFCNLNLTNILQIHHIVMHYVCLL